MAATAVAETVVGPAGEEIYVNEDGCIRVHFHWDRYNPANEKASCWIRVSQGWNGSGFGMMAIPRIGQEVIVSYLNGDVDRPIVTGMTYNALNHPPYALPAKKNSIYVLKKTSTPVLKTTRNGKFCATSITK